VKDSELLPCPFCGGSPKVVRFFAQGMDVAQYWVECFNRRCVSRPKTRATPLSWLAKKRWNIRSDT